jgi:O-antigen ligase
MLNRTMELILLLLIAFTPLPWGAVDFWASFAMEIGILFIVLIWAGDRMKDRRSISLSPLFPLPLCLLLLLFLGLVLLQMVRLPAGVIDLLSPRTVELRHQLNLGGDLLKTLPLSFFPFATKIEFFKWVTLIGFFLFLLHWKPLANGSRVLRHLLTLILIMGVFESSYGLFKFFGVHHGLAADGAGGVYSVLGTFINPNHFAGYLLMVIPLSVGFLFSREAHKVRRTDGRLRPFSRPDGNVLLMGFGIILMILSLFFSSSRMGILSLVLSFGLIAFLCGGDHEGRRFSTRAVLILGVAVFWAVWIGLDAVVSRFFGASEDFHFRRTIWQNTSQILKDFPLFGSGLGTFRHIFPMYRSFHLRGMVTHAENDFLQLASEVGLVGFLPLVILFLLLFLRGASRIRSLSPGDPRRYIGVGGLVGILALLFHSQVERNMQVPANAFLFTLLWGIVLTLPPQETKIKSTGKNP